MHSIRNRYLQEVREFIQSFGKDGTSPGGRSFELIDSIVSLEENYSMLRILLGMKEGMIPLPQDIQILLSERRKALSEYLRRIQSGEITVAWILRLNLGYYNLGNYSYFVHDIGSCGSGGAIA